ncbi:hypothetical protein HYS03_01170 [Candidatus Woesebacteria bacterium]|nr:hypothetical protein [Candidatus Woesebacteria bacterium]QQG47778.1 MAG: hypothetical protein HY044_01670 [Candidatus Woesebacteria bacterium]
MKLFFDNKASKIAQQEKLIFVDNDFLGLIFHDEEVMKESITVFSGKMVHLHPFTEFEFLRDVFSPKIRIFKEQFLAQPIFGHIDPDTHMQIFQHLLDNALLLSKIFAHQAGSGNKNTSSFVDLLLAGLLMFLKDKAVLITSNKKDFSSCVFDIVGIINIEQNDGSIRTICILEFNQGKFNNCLEKLNKVQN